MGVEQREAGRWKREGKANGRKPVGVSEETKQAGDIRGRWRGVEPSVWTERMLTEGVYC